MDAKTTKSNTLPGVYKLCPYYDTMFSDTRPRNRVERNFIPERMSSSLQPILKSTEEMKQKMEVQGSHRTLFYRQPSRRHVSSYSTITVNLNGSGKKVSFEGERKYKKEKMIITLPVKTEKMITKGTQTDYRESEAQTLPWRHDIKAHGKIYSELLSMDWFDFEKNYPPGKEEAEIIEKNLQKLFWEDIVDRLKGKENERKRKFLVMKMAENEMGFRNRRKEEENRERIELSKQQMEEMKKAAEEKLWLRMQRSYRSRRKENDEKIDYWNHQLNRKIRKMKSGRQQKVTKENIISLHMDKASMLYAPKLRDGQNPSLGHEVIDIQCRYLKRYHGLQILEKHITSTLHPKFVKPGFKSETSQPKNFLCSRKFREKVLEKPKEFNLNGSSLRVPIPPPTPEIPTPRVIGVEEEEERLFQSSLLLGKILKGRSIQTRKLLEFLEKSKKVGR